MVLTFLWLRKYPCIDTLALFFDVSRSTVSNIIHSVVPVLWRFFSNEVTWPSIAEWNRMQGEWRFFLMPWAVSMERLMKFIAPRLSPKLNFIAATAIIMG